LARKILLADDSVTAQNMGRRILSDAGYEVITVNNGAAALKKIGEIRPDLIVLDVYMPGYGGLEVCQRIKESPDTARIPVLLTVGKMEPFKAEEAKRVRADGHIIKPFEASELLTALTKLEDKIVPLADPKKAGRSGKTSASNQKVEQADAEWKTRLRIPPPAAKPLEPEANVPEESTAVAQVTSTFKAKVLAIDADAVKEITPEDIAAIVSRGIPGPKDSESTQDAQGSSAEKANTEVSKQAGPSKLDEAHRAAEPIGETKSAHDEPEVETATFASAPLNLSDTSSELPKAMASESEFLTALASLLPAAKNEHPVEQDANLTASAKNSKESFNQAVSDITGPRWVAHSVALTEDESKLLLENEIQKTSTAHAEAEAPASFSSGNMDESAAVSTALISAATASVVEPVSPQEIPSLTATPIEIGTPTHDTTISVSSNVHQEMFANAPAPGDEAQPAENPETIDGGTKVEESHGEAFAAAASAGPATVESVSVESISHLDSGVLSSTNVESANVIASPEKSNSQADRQRETELAAAWQNWKQIRETIVGTNETQTVSAPISSTMDSAASVSSESTAPSGFKDLRSEPKAPLQLAEEALAEPVAEDSAIASIVDNMLADLKPKLMEEIARKMAKEKK